ncbi:MAG TPA: DUF3109 family protein [Flavipsychrobacter sp.]|nr:DUF3109 family protein [Flavipsychrobacter sp.]
MIAVGGVLLSDEVIEENFVCDLLKCKGGCCVDGDCGAPLTKEETKTIANIYPKIKPYLSAEYIAEVDKQGTHVMDDEYGYVTPTINGGICVYAYTDELGIVKCAIEKAYNDGVVDFKKPISCHLYPIRIKQLPGYEAVNYEPRPTLCRPACKQGNKLKVPVYKFLKEPIIRKFGEDFYKELDEVAKQYRKHKGL